MEYLLILLEYLQIIFIAGLLGLIIYYLIHIGNRYVVEDKKFEITRKHIIITVLSALVILLLYYIFNDSSQVAGLISPVLYSIAFAYLLNPFVNFFEKKGISRVWGTLLIYLLLGAFVTIIAILFFPKISSEFQNLVTQLPEYSKETIDFFNDLYNKYTSNIENLPPELQGIKDVVSENINRIQTILISSVNGLMNSIINMFSKIIGLIIIPVLTFYFIKDKELFKRKMYLAIPKKFRADSVRVSREIDSVLARFIRGQMIIALFVGVTTTIGLLIIGIDYALLIGLMAGIANFVPFFGPIIGIIPAFLFALLDDPMKIIWVLILFAVIQQVESNIMAPKIVGDSVGIHPVVVILALLVGASTMGIIGMLLAVPIAGVIKILTSFIIEKLAHS